MVAPRRVAAAARAARSGRCVAKARVVASIARAAIGATRREPAAARRARLLSSISMPQSMSRLAELAPASRGLNGTQACGIVVELSDAVPAVRIVNVYRSERADRELPVGARFFDFVGGAVTVDEARGASSRPRPRRTRRGDFAM